MHTAVISCEAIIEWIFYPRRIAEFAGRHHIADTLAERGAKQVFTDQPPHRGCVIALAVPQIDGFAKNVSIGLVECAGLVQILEIRSVVDDCVS